MSGSVSCNYESQDGLVVLGSYYYGGSRNVCFALYSSELSEWRIVSADGIAGFKSLELKDGTLHFTVNVPVGTMEVYVCIIQTGNFPTT